MKLDEMRNILSIAAENLDVKEAFDLCGAKWIYQGKKGEPHALLASGGHSDGYFNVNAVIQFPNLCKGCALNILPKLVAAGVNNIDAVVSSSYAALPFGKAVADMLGAVFVFTEKQDNRQIWTGRFELPEGARVLQVEELITTTETTERVRRTVMRANLKSVEFVEANGRTVVATIVHRPRDMSVECIGYKGYKVIALMKQEVHNWAPEECPLCEEGSEALKPKPNWQRFIKH